MLFEDIKEGDKFLTKSGSIAEFINKFEDDNMYRFKILGLPYERVVLINNRGESVFAHKFDILEKINEEDNIS